MKKLLCVITATILALALTGCDNASGITEPTGPTSPVTPVQTTPAPTTPPTTPAPTTQATTPAPTEPTTAEPVDELEVLRVPESYAEKTDGIYLKRNRKVYAIEIRGGEAAGGVPRVVDRKYVVGNGGATRIGLYGGESSKVNGAWVPSGVLSYGEVPVPAVEKSDLIIGYFSKEPFTLILRRVDFHGYTVPVILDDSGNLKVQSRKAGTDGLPNILLGKTSDISITDGAGNSPDDVRNLEYGKEYIVSWYSGTQYNEEKMIANCSYYTYPNQEGLIYLTGELTKNGYAVFDTSSLDPGFYKTINGMVIKIE